MKKPVFVWQIPGFLSIFVPENLNLSQTKLNATTKKGPQTFSQSPCGTTEDIASGCIHDVASAEDCMNAY